MTTSRLLLDTQVLLWWHTDHHQLKQKARQAIVQADEVYISAVTPWEIAIKRAIGRVEKLPEGVSETLAECGFLPLAVELAHAELISHLPLLHHDPFDRMLVAQALVEGLTLVTHDKKVASYDVPILLT